MRGCTYQDTILEPVSMWYGLLPFANDRCIWSLAITEVEHIFFFPEKKKLYKIGRQRESLPLMWNLRKPTGGLMGREGGKEDGKRSCVYCTFWSHTHCMCGRLIQLYQLNSLKRTIDFFNFILLRVYCHLCKKKKCWKLPNGLSSTGDFVFSIWLWVDAVIGSWRTDITKCLIRMGPKFLLPNF